MSFNTIVVHFAAYFNEICQKAYLDNRASTSHHDMASGGSIAISTTTPGTSMPCPAGLATTPQEEMQQTSVSTNTLLNATPKASASTTLARSLDLALLGVAPTGVRQQCSLLSGRLRCSSVVACVRPIRSGELAATVRAMQAKFALRFSSQSSLKKA